ncbi:MAG TPA: hypothetical protein VND99_05515 [Candidatus Acidoferrales bacterium]|nr:hypothetical protein [Candidatus Acidoferrales bacterium]
MKMLAQITKFTRKSVLICVLVAAAVVGVAAYSNAQALTISSVRDCDNNSVMYCGAGSVGQVQNQYANGVSGHNSAGSIQHIYSYFGISGSDINSMSQYAVEGDVYKDGNVKVNGEVVATNVWTAGRWYIPGSNKVSYGGTTFYKRHPSVSFVSSPLKAFVVMKDGKFQFAILVSCGNPVIGQARTPNYSIEKQVRVLGQSNWQNSVSVKQGTHVEFRVIVRSTGEVSASNIKVRDQLPNYINFVSNSLRRDGQWAYGVAFFSGTGNIIDRLRPGDSVIYTFEAIVGKYDNPYTCRQLTNTAMITAPGLPYKSNNAGVNETCVQKPSPSPKPTPTCTPTPAPSYPPHPSYPW